jgi:hypothetical protein
VGIFLVIFAGFARTYYLKALFGTRALPLLLHLHGLILRSGSHCFSFKYVWSLGIVSICIAAWGLSAPCWPHLPHAWLLQFPFMREGEAIWRIQIHWP